MGANPRALGYFGLRWMQEADKLGILERLEEFGLPVMTCPTTEHMSANNHLISTLFSRNQEVGYRRLVVAFDRTYLVQTHQLSRCYKGSILSGGAHRPQGFTEPDESMLVIDRSAGEVQFDTTNVKKANEVESCLVWDSTREHSPKVEIASWPVTSAATKDATFERLMTNPVNQRGKWETLVRLAPLFEETTSIRFIIADGHGSHEYLHKMLLGQKVEIPQELLESLPFWPQLRYQDLPGSERLNLGFRVCMVKNEVISYMPGIAHIAKNAVEQMRSSLRTIMFGQLCVDASGALQNGMWPAAFCGSDAMSDRQAALWFHGSSC